MSLLTNGYCTCQFIIVHIELDNTYEMAILILIIKVKNHFSILLFFLRMQFRNKYMFCSCFCQAVGSTFFS